MPVKILLAEDQTIIRESLKTAIQLDTNIEIIAEACSGREAYNLTLEHNPDIILMDIGMDDWDGIEASKRIKEVNENYKILILTMFQDKSRIIKALDAGIDGYIFKMSNLDELINAIHTIAEGDNYFSKEVSDILKNNSRQLSNDDKTNVLSVTENEILMLIGKGFSARDISVQLNNSIHTIRTHIKNIQKKLELHNIAALVKYAIEHNLS
jgi:DNA-binding NarL/FixJ family response regulator